MQIFDLGPEFVWIYIVRVTYLILDQQFAKPLTLFPFRAVIHKSDEKDNARKMIEMHHGIKDLGWNWIGEKKNDDDESAKIPS